MLFRSTVFAGQTNHQGKTVMRTTQIHLLSAVLILASIFFSQAAFAVAIIGDVKDTKEGMKQAIQCNYDEALKKLDKAIKEGGFAAELAVLEKIVVLMDAGREKEANEVMAERNERTDASEDEIEKTEASVEETLENLRDEREKQTGSRACP
jgi:hypothetical protein